MHMILWSRTNAKSYKKYWQNLNKIIAKIWQCLNANNYGNKCMTNKQISKYKNTTINRINIIANYHINLEFYP